MRRRGQLVLVAAAVVAVALAPVVVAYLQLGYQADVRTAASVADPGENAERLLGRGVHEASVDVRGEYDWSERRAAIDAVRRSLRPRLRTLERSRVADGTVYRTGYNATVGRTWARANCPRGDGRRFGGCTAREGVVVQRRAGEVTLLAVAFDVDVTTDGGERRLTIVVRAVGDR